MIRASLDAGRKSPGITPEFRPPHPGGLSLWQWYSEQAPGCERRRQLPAGDARRAVCHRARRLILCAAPRRGRSECRPRRAGARASYLETTLT